ncbi:phosphopantothenate/pantothenate synthetase [Candidatus Woesearchaeota archaeon]|nr:phosphopantothenate/pantothenate synthetase [Candidatus Woesearchaeota archaeon]
MIPKSHPRYESLRTRNLIVNGIKEGITSLHGLIAHGRGEAFDYLLGEKTSEFAEKSIGAGAALLITAKNPVISVNGNSAVLVPNELAEISHLLSAPFEINIFHASKKREIKIKNHLIKNGAENVLLPDKRFKIRHLQSNRKYVNKNGILKADVVFVPLEDGDRTEALVRNRKKVIAVDINPLSRTARKATVTIVDNITRAMPLLIKTIKQYKKHDNKRLQKMAKGHDNRKNLKGSLNYMLQNFP